MMDKTKVDAHFQSRRYAAWMYYRLRSRGGMAIIRDGVRRNTSEYYRVLSCREARRLGLLAVES